MATMKSLSLYLTLLAAPIPSVLGAEPAPLAAPDKVDLDNPLSTGQLKYPDAARIITNPTERLKYLALEEAWKWWELILSEEFLPRSEKTGLGAVVGGLAEDDLVVHRFQVAAGSVQIIDGRSITLVLEIKDPSKFTTPSFRAREPVFPNDPWTEPVRPLPTGRSPQQFELENFVHAVFRRAFRFDSGRETWTVPTEISTTHFDNPSHANGLALVRRDADSFGPNNWLMNGAITWWSDGKTMVFDIRKLIRPVARKGPTPGAPYVYGLPFDDKRQFRRFSPSNIDFTELLVQAFNDPRLKRFVPYHPKTDTSGYFNPIPQPKGKVMKLLPDGTLAPKYEEDGRT